LHLDNDKIELIADHGVKGVSLRFQDKIIAILDEPEFAQMTIAEVIGSLQIISYQFQKIACDES